MTKSFPAASMLPISHHLFRCFRRELPSLSVTNRLGSAKPLQACHFEWHNKFGKPCPFTHHNGKFINTLLFYAPQMTVKMGEIIRSNEVDQFQSRIYKYTYICMNKVCRAVSTWSFWPLRRRHVAVKIMPTKPRRFWMTFHHVYVTLHVQPMRNPWECYDMLRAMRSRWVCKKCERMYGCACMTCVA